MRRLALFAAMLGLFAACQKGPSAPPGRGLFVSLGCRTCHRVGGEGGKGGPDLTFVGFRRSRAWLDLWLKDPQAWKPDTLMPNPHLSAEARAKIIDYMMSLKGEAFNKEGRPWDDAGLRSDAAGRGHVLFTRAGCIGCHGKAGMGGYPNNNVVGGKIPALINVSQTYTKEELAAKIRKGVKPVKADASGPEPLVFMPPWGETLKEDEIDAVATYLLTLKPDQTVGADW